MTVGHAIVCTAVGRRAHGAELSSAAGPLQSGGTSTAVGSLTAAGGLAADLVAAQQVAEAAKKRLKLAEAALSGEVQRREVAERQLSSAQELLRR